VNCKGLLILKLFTDAHTVFLVGIPEKSALGRPRRKWEDNIRVGLREIGWEDVTGCICLSIEANSGIF